MDDNFLIWKLMPLSKLEEELYALQIDYNPPLTERQRPIVLQKLEAFIKHAIYTSYEELEEEVRAKWRATRKEMNTSCYNPKYPKSKESSSLYSNAQIVFLEDKVDGKTIYYCILRGAELDSAISTRANPITGRNLTNAQLQFLIAENKNNPYPRIKVGNIIEECDKRIFNRLYRQRPPVYTDLVNTIRMYTDIDFYKFEHLRKFIVELNVEQYNLFLTDISLDTKLEVVAGKSRDMYVVDILELFLREYQYKGGNRMYVISNMIEEFMYLVNRNVGYDKLYVSESIHYHTGRMELYWKPREIKYLKVGNNTSVHHYVSSSLGPKFEINLVPDEIHIKYLDINNAVEKLVEYKVETRKKFRKTLYLSEGGSYVTKTYYNDGKLKKEKLYIQKRLVKSDTYNKKKNLIVSKVYGKDSITTTYYSILEQQPLTVKTETDGDILTTTIYYRITDANFKERLYLMEKRTFNKASGEFTLTLYNLDGNPVPFQMSSGVKGYNMYKVVVESPNGKEKRNYSTEGNLSFATQYDVNGNVTKYIWYNNKGFVSEIIRHKDGRILSTERVNMEEGIIRKINYVYEFYPTGIVKSSTAYDGNGNKTEIRSYTPEGKKDQVLFFDRGKLRTIEYYDSDEKLNIMQGFKPDGNLDSERYFSVVEPRILYFNREGKISSITYLREDGGIERTEEYMPNSKRVVHYNSDGEIKKVEELALDDTTLRV